MAASKAFDDKMSSVLAAIDAATSQPQERERLSDEE
jgi:hypothetical protein